MGCTPETCQGVSADICCNSLILQRLTATRSLPIICPHRAILISQFNKRPPSAARPACGPRKPRLCPNLGFRFLKRLNLFRISAGNRFSTSNLPKTPGGGGVGGHPRKGKIHVRNLPSRHAQRALLPVACHPGLCLLLLPWPPHSASGQRPVIGASRRDTHNPRPERNPPRPPQRPPGSCRRPHQCSPRIHSSFGTPNGRQPPRDSLSRTHRFHFQSAS